ncbi:MAG: bifunctional riboflavin kinase/FAD synthetase [Gemmataceae bacterium]
MATHQIDWRDTLPAECRNGAIAIGNFDGAHCGHARLIEELSQAAQTVAGPAVAVTFHPHPRALLRPQALTEVLTTLADRTALLHQLGADHVVVLCSTIELFRLRAADFFDQVIVRSLAARAMVEGPNFCFGYEREGDIPRLRALCAAAEIDLRIVPPVLLEETEVSSSRIREALMQGDLVMANRLLGRPYQISGVVGPGERRGRTLGFPTANLQQIPTVVPAEGVYAVTLRLESGARHAGAANIGANPTFEESARKVEIHLIGFDGDLYGQKLDVNFHARLRDTRRFNSVEELVSQLNRDVDQARQIGQELLAGKTAMNARTP